MTTNTLDLVIQAAPPCGERAARALSQRVSALRAALDAIRTSIPAEDALQAPVVGALVELDGLSRDVRALIDWTLPSPTHPLDCSLEEIGIAAVDALRHERRGRTLVAVERPATRAFVDGHLASRSLARLLDHGFACGADGADLRLEPREGGFAATASFIGAGRIPGERELSIACTLAESLALRDLARLGARVEPGVATDGVPHGTVAVFAGASAEVAR